jgi:membrane associated rhomboid family serine protease
MDSTLTLIIITCIVSISAFYNPTIIGNLILWPRQMNEPKEYHRLLSSGFIHADWMHLIFNMITLYFFGRNVELLYAFSGIPAVYYWVLYLLGIVVASLPSFFSHRQDAYYRSLGASGGVAAVLFAFIYFAPWETIYLWFIPVPAILAAVGYLVYAAYMSKKGGDNINHDAHFYGAVFGFLFTLLFEPTHGSRFVSQLLHPHFNF